jgi:hypothetical protein
MSIVSDDPNNFTQPPENGSRRVSVLIALPVVLGCAVLGSIFGVTLPLRSILPSEHREPDDLTLAQVRLMDDSPAASQPRPATDLPAPLEAVVASSVASQGRSSPSSAVTSVRTGSVDRLSSPGARENAALVVPAQSDVARAESPSRATGHSQRIARAKRLRRVLWRRARSSKPQTSELEFLFAPIFPKK